MTLRKMLAIAIAVAAIGFFTSSNTAAAATAPNITYTAKGTFAATPTSGSDTLKLAGEPFTVTIVVSASTVPYKTGKNWAAYNKLKLTGQVNSGLLGSTPVSIASGEASIQQYVNPGNPDLFIMQAPINVVGIKLTIKASITLPAGTLTKPLLHTFGTVNLTPSVATLTYSDTTNTTVLAIQTGTLTATAPAAPTGKSSRAALRPGNGIQ